MFIPVKVILCHDVTGQYTSFVKKPRLYEGRIIEVTMCMLLESQILTGFRVSIKKMLCVSYRLLAKPRKHFVNIVRAEKLDWKAFALQCVQSAWYKCRLICTVTALKELLEWVQPRISSTNWRCRSGIKLFPVDMLYSFGTFNCTSFSGDVENKIYCRVWTVWSETEWLCFWTNINAISFLEASRESHIGDKR